MEAVGECICFIDDFHDHLDTIYLCSQAVNGNIDERGIRLIELGAYRGCDQGMDTAGLSITTNTSHLFLRLYAVEGH